MLDVEENLSTVAVVLDEDVKRVGTVDPSEETRVGRERDNGVLDNREMALERLGILLEEGVDETEELHDPLVLTKIFVALEEEVVLDAIAAVDAKLARTLLRGEDLEVGTEAGDADDALARLVGTGNGEVEVLGGEKLGRDVLKLEEGEGREVLVDLPEDLQEQDGQHRCRGEMRAWTNLVVEVPSVVEIVDLAVLTVATTRLASVGKITAEGLGEGDLPKRLGSL